MNLHSYQVFPMSLLTDKTGLQPSKLNTPRISSSVASSGISLKMIVPRFDGFVLTLIRSSTTEILGEFSIDFLTNSSSWVRALSFAN